MNWSVYFWFWCNVLVVKGRFGGFCLFVWWWFDVELLGIWVCFGNVKCNELGGYLFYWCCIVLFFYWWIFFCGVRSGYFDCCYFELGSVGDLESGFLNFFWVGVSCWMGVEFWFWGVIWIGGWILLCFFFFYVKKWMS